MVRQQQSRMPELKQVTLTCQVWQQAIAAAPCWTAMPACCCCAACSGAGSKVASTLALTLALCLTLWSAACCSLWGSVEDRDWAQTWVRMWLSAWQAGLAGARAAVPLARPSNSPPAARTLVMPSCLHAATPLTASAMGLTASH